MTQATGSSFFTQAMALATANTTSTTLLELLAFMTSRLGQQRANTLVQKVGHLLTLEQQYTLQETYLYGSSRLGVKNQQLNLSTRVASVQNGSLTPIGNAILNTDSVFTGTAAVYGLPKAPSARIFNRTWGLKQYELSNHLGNVQVTISDKKLGVAGANQEDFIAYEPEVKSATDYYAYGMEMPGKAYQSTAYRYGMNTQEKDNEIYGPGNTLGALYWEYDARIARRWNVDPVVKPNESGYSVLNSNPIVFVDLNGDDFENVHTKRKEKAKEDVEKASLSLDAAKEQFKKFEGLSRDEIKKQGRIEEYDNTYNQLSKAQENYDSKIKIYNDEVYFESVVNEIIKEFERTNPEKFKEWMTFNPTGNAVLNIQLSAQNEPIRRLDSNGFPTGQTTSEGIKARFNSENDFVRIRLQVIKSNGVVKIQAMTSLMVHALGHIDEGVSQDEDYANAYQTNNYDKKK